LDELDNAKLIITGAIRGYVQDTYNIPIAKWGMIVLPLGDAEPKQVRGAMSEVRRVLIWGIDATEAPDDLFGGYKHIVAYVLASAVLHWATHCKEAAYAIYDLIQTKVEDRPRWQSLAYACEALIRATQIARDYRGPARLGLSRENVLLGVNEFLLIASQALHIAHGIQQEYRPLRTGDGY